MFNYIITSNKKMEIYGIIEFGDVHVDFSVLDGILDIDYFNIIEATIEDYEVDFVVNQIQENLKNIIGEFR